MAELGDGIIIPGDIGLSTFLADGNVISSSEDILIYEDHSISNSKINNIEDYKKIESVLIANHFFKKGNLKWHTQS